MAADTGVTTVDGYVSEIAPLIGAPVTQPVASRRPALVSADALSWVDFDGSDDHLLTGAINGAVREVHIAVRSAYSGDDARVAYGAFPAGGPRSFAAQANNRLGAGIGNTGLGDTLSTSPAGGATRVIGFSHDGITRRVYTDGVLAFSGAQSGSAASGIVSYIGSANLAGAASYPWQGRVHALCDMPRLLNG